MTYPTLATINSTPDQDLGLQVAFKHDLATKRTTARSPEEYLAQFVIAKLEDLAIEHVSGEKYDRILAKLKSAFDANDVVLINKVATDVNADIVIDPNAIETSSGPVDVPRSISPEVVEAVPSTDAVPTGVLNRIKGWING